MTESVKVRTSKLADGQDAQELRALLAAVVDGLQAIATKLDADSAVAETDYAATVAKIIQD